MAKSSNTGWGRAPRAVAALTGMALVMAPVVAQVTAPEAARDAAEQRRAQQRDERQREQGLIPRDVRLPAPEALPAARLPVAETPCVPVRQIVLRGDLVARFGWLLDGLAGPDGTDGPLRRCLGDAAIRVVAERAQAALLARGYVTSRVLVEPQDLRQGELALTVVPGRIRHIRWAEPVSGRVTLANALPAQAGDVLNLRDIEQGLENVKRVPTVEADIQIVGADQPGYSDLLVRWRQGRPVRLSLSVDDSGARSTGKYQGSATLSLDNPFALNDLFYLGVQRNLSGHDANNGGTDGQSLHYSLPMGHYLMALDLSRHGYHQRVAGFAQDYLYRGTSASQALTLSRVLYRGASHRSTLQLQAFSRQSRNFIDDTEIEVQRRRVGGWQLGLAHRAFLGAGTLDANLGFRRGTGAFGALRAPEEAFGEGTSRFALLHADVRWQQPLRLGTQPWHYSAQWRAQINRTPLSPQERFAIGGSHTVRGFDGEASLSAERGWLWRNELSTPLGVSGSSAFVGLDHGQVGGPGAQGLVGTRLTGAVLGLRGGVGALQYEVFAGAPVSRPPGFRTARTAFGLQLLASF